MRLQNFFRQKSGGFTLIELLVALSVLAVVSVVGLTTYTSTQIAGRDSKRKTDLQQIRVALESYYQTNRQYPAFHGDSFNNPTPWFPGMAPTYINILPKDPTNNSTYNYKYMAWYQCPVVSPYLPTGYALAVNLENPSDPDGKAVSFTAMYIPPSVCLGGGGGCFGGFNSNHAYSFSEKPAMYIDASGLCVPS